MAEIPAEPAVGTILAGYVHGDLAGAWHRTPDGWTCTYVGTAARPYTWSEALARGASPTEELHSAPTQDAYDRACAALHKHRERADRAEAALREARAQVAEEIAVRPHIEAAALRRAATHLHALAGEEIRPTADHYLGLLADHLERTGGWPEDQQEETCG